MGIDKIKIKTYKIFWLSFFQLRLTFNYTFHDRDEEEVVNWTKKISLKNFLVQWRGYAKRSNGHWVSYPNLIKIIMS